MIEFILALLWLPTLFLLFLAFIFFIPRNKKYFKIFYIMQYCMFNERSNHTTVVINDMINLYYEGKLTSKVDDQYISFYSNNRWYCSIFVHGKYYLYGTLTWPNEDDKLIKDKYSPDVSTFLRIMEFDNELRNKI